MWATAENGATIRSFPNCFAKRAITSRSSPTSFCPKLNKSMFDTRNDSLHIFDEDLVREYARLKSQEGRHNLTIFHLIGQHVGYKFRTPNDRRRWNGTDYKTLRPDLTPGQRSVLALYDDAVLYNDSVVDLIVKQFENEDAIVIYMQNHG